MSSEPLTWLTFRSKIILTEGKASRCAAGRPGWLQLFPEPRKQNGRSMTALTDSTSQTVTSGGEPAEPTPNRARQWYRRHSTPVHTVATIILGVIVWQVAAAHTSTLIMAPLGDIWDAFLDGIRSGQLPSDAWESLQGFLIGFAIAIVAGIAIGVLMAVSKVIFDFLDPWLSAMYSTPLIALAPLYIIIFGIGGTTRIAVVVTMALFPIVLNTSAGIRTADPNLVETARSFGANRWQVFGKVLMPSSIPFIITGLRLAVGRGLMGIVVAEFFGSTSGLGYRVFTSSQTFDTPAVWMGVFVLAAIGVISIRLMYILERKIAPWRNNSKNGGKVL